MVIGAQDGAPRARSAFTEPMISGCLPQTGIFVLGPALTCCPAIVDYLATSVQALRISFPAMSASDIEAGHVSVARPLAGRLSKYIPEEFPLGAACIYFCM